VSSVPWSETIIPGLPRFSMTQPAITLRDPMAPRAGQLLTPRRKAYQMPRL
jgi:hypothetical protein